MSLNTPTGDANLTSGPEAFESAGAYAVKLPVFEGPLDLLLHLIRQNEVEITDIPIALIGEQYLEYLGLMRELDIDVAAEYLVMAATLALIKSRMLLPSTDDPEDEEEADPRAELVARLLEYQLYKEAAQHLSTRRRLGRDVFEAQTPALEALPQAEREIEVGLFELLNAFQEMLESTRASGVHQVEVETVTVRERMDSVVRQIEMSESIEFTQLFASTAGGHSSRAMLVATFLAVLELARLGALRLYQSCSALGAPEGPIRVRAVKSEPGVVQAASFELVEEGD